MSAMIARRELAKLRDGADLARRHRGFRNALARSSPPPFPAIRRNFRSMPVVTVLRDGEQPPIWAIRLARAAHQIAADSLRIEMNPAGHVYQLWLSVPDAKAPRRLGVLPQSGRERIAVSPQSARLLTGVGELLVIPEPPGGPPGPAPSGRGRHGGVGIRQDHDRARLGTASSLAVRGRRSPPFG